MAQDNPFYLDSGKALQGVQQQDNPNPFVDTSAEPIEMPKIGAAAARAIAPPGERSAPAMSSLAERLSSLVPVHGEEIDLGIQAPQPAVTPPAEEKGDYRRGLEKSYVQAKQTAYGTAALIGDTIGNKGLQDWGLKGYQEKEAEVQKLTKETDSLKSFTEGKGDLIDWMQQGAGYLTGQVLEFGASALAGAAIGSVLPGAGTVGGAVIGFVEKEAAKKGIKGYVAKMLEEKFAEGVAARKLTEEAAAKYAGRAVMSAVGAKAGSMLASSTMELGSIYGDAIEQAHKTGEDYHLGKIWLTGIGAAALDSAMDWMNVGKMGKAMGGKDAPMSFFKEAFKAGAREGITEFMQTGIERYGASKDLTGAEAMWDYIDSAALGAFGGSLVGGGSAGISKVMGKADPVQQGKDQGREDARRTLQGEQTGGQTGVGDGKSFALNQPALLEALEGQPGMLSALYNRASEADQKEIFKAANRMNLLDELQASEGDLTKANELIASDPDHATFLLNSLVNIGKTPPKGGLVKMPQKGMTLDDLDKIDQGIANDPNAMASMQRDAEAQRAMIAAKRGVDPDSLRSGQKAPQGAPAGGQGVGANNATPTPPAAPKGLGGMSLSEVYDRLVPKVAPTNYGDFKYSAPAVRGGFESLRVDLSQVSPSGKGGKFTYADLKRVNDLLFTADKASKSTQTGALFSKNEDGEALGVYIPQAKTVFYSSAAKNLSPERRYALELHEAGAHFGIPRMVGDQKYSELLTELAGMKGKDKIVDEAFASIPGSTPDSDINHEALGYLVENYQNMGIVKKLMQMMKDWYHQTFKGKTLTATQLHGMAKAAMRQYGHELRKVNLNDRIVTKPEAGRVKVDFQSALGTNQQAHQFLDFMSQFGNGVALTGSLALSPQLDIYRPENEQIHDLDFRVMDPSRLPEIMEKLQQTFPNSALSKTFASKKANAETIQLVVDKDAANPLHIDLFVPNGDSFGRETVPHTYTGADGQQRTISLNNAKSIFDAKFAFGRAKDVNDAIQSGGIEALYSKKASAEPGSPRRFLEAIGRAGGIKFDLIKQLSGERGGKGSKGRGNVSMPQAGGSLFRANGLNLDELALLMVEAGYLTDADIDSRYDNGGVNKLSEMIDSALRGEKIYSIREQHQAEIDFERSLQQKYEDEAEQFLSSEPSAGPRKIDASKVNLNRAPESQARPNTPGPVRLTGTSPYLAKDQKKADVATKFIGRGSASSSTAGYAKNFGDRANTGVYSPQDVVFVSAEGNRSNRIEPDFAEIKLALDAGATIVTDDAANRNRPYNIGERQVAEFLTSNGYRESAPGRWSAAASTQSTGKPPAPPDAKSFVGAFNNLSSKVYSLLQAAEDNGVNYDPGYKIHQLLDGASYALEETGDLDSASNFILEAQQLLSEKNRGKDLAARLKTLGDSIKVSAEFYGMKNNFDTLSGEVYQFLRNAEDNGVDYDPGNKISQALDAASFALDEDNDLKRAADFILDADAALRPRNEALALRLYDLGEQMRIAAGATDPTRLEPFEVGGDQNVPEDIVRNRESIRSGPRLNVSIINDTLEDIQSGPAQPASDTPAAPRIPQTQGLLGTRTSPPKVVPAGPFNATVAEAPRPKDAEDTRPAHIQKLASRAGNFIPQALVDEVSTMHSQGKVKESEDAAASVERIYKAQMDGVVKPGDQLKIKAALERKGAGVTQRIAAAEQLVDAAYEKETIPDKGVLNRAKRVQKYFNAIAAKYNLPDAAVDVGGSKRTVSALNAEIESLLQGDTTKQNVVTANELLAVVAQARMKQVLDVAGAKGQGLIKNMVRVTTPDRRATDTVTERNREPKDGQVSLGGRMTPGKESGMLRPATNLVSDIENADGTTTRISITDITEPEEKEEKEEKAKKKATEPDPVYPDFWSNYYGGSTASVHFRRLVDLVVEQYLRMLPVAGKLKDLTGVAKQYYGKIGSGKRSAVGKMWRTLDRKSFTELVKMTGREREAVPEPTEADIALMQYKNDVLRAMLMTERPNIFTAFGQTYVAKDKKGFKEALIVANERLNNLFAAINGIQKTGNVKNQDVGGVFSQMEFPSGSGDRASEAAMVDIKSRAERSIEGMKAEARDLQETIVMLQRGMVREAAQKFNQQLNEVKADIERLSVEAVERGAPQNQVMEIREEAMRSIVVYQQFKKRQSKPSGKSAEVADLDQSGPVGIEAAKALVSDFKNKKIDLPSAVAAVSGYLKDGEFTQSQLVDAFREQGADIPDALLHSFREVASRNRMADFVRRNGGGYAKRSEWMHSMNNVVENRKFYAQNSALRDMNPLAGFTPVEIDLYKEWKAARADLARRQQDRGDLSQSSDLVEEAFPDLLFVRFTLDEMRDFKKIRKDSARAMIRGLFGDPDTAVNAYFEDIVYAASKRPDLIKTIPDYLPAEEVADFAKWRVQRIAAEKLRAKMIEDSKYFLALERIVPNPSSGYYQEKFPDQEQRRKEIRRATRLWNKFKYLGEKDRIEILQNEAKIREGASPVAKNTGEMDESLLQDLISDLMLVNREDYSADERIASFDRAAATPMQGEYTDLENLGDQSAEDVLNAGETNLDDVRSGIQDLEAANLNFDEDPEYMASQDEEADQQQDDDDIRTARGAYSGAATAAIVQVWAARISKGWRGGPAIKVLNNASQLDEPIRSMVLEKLGEASEAKGLYVTDEGTVYLFSDYLTGEADAEWTVFHEAYGHYGMRAFLGNRLDAFLQTVYLTRPEIRKLAEAKAKEDKLGLLEAVEEVLADRAGDAKYGGLFTQMLGRLTQWLRNHGFETVANYLAKVSDAEVSYVLRSARDAVREGTPAPFRGAPIEVRLAQQQRTPYEAFAIKGGKTLGYARYDPWRNTWYVFNAINGDPTNYAVQSMSNYADVQKFLRTIGRFEARLRSGHYIDNKLLPDLTQGIPDYRDNPSWVRRQLDSLQLNVQNEYLPVFRVIEWLKKNGGRVTDLNDITKDLGGIYERQTAAKLERFRKNYVEPMMDLAREAKRLGATEEFINDFAVARHAEERNAQVRKINPGNKYGSGMAPRQITTKDGRVIKGYEDVLDEARRRGLYDTLEKIGKLTDRMSRAKIHDQQATGLLHPSDAERRLAAYKHYVNLSGVNDDLDKYDDPGIVGQKFGRPSKEHRAMGRGDVAPDVLARTIAAAEAAIIQGQKNVLKQRLLMLMEENHDPNFVSINKYATKREIGEDGFVHEVEDTRYLSDKSIMLVRVKGIPVTMQFKQTGKGSFAEAMLGAVYPPEASAPLALIGKYQNIVGQMLTTWNPVWVGINFMRDAQTLMFNAAVDKRIGTAKAALMVRRILPAARASIYVAMNEYNPTTGSGKAAKAFFQKMIGQPDPKMLTIYQQAKDAGALTSFIDRKGLENQIEQIHKAMTGQNATGRIRGFLDFMELLTIPMEMGPRLAAYSVTREMGWSQRDAAQFAGEITVNFNMRGKQAWLRQLYLFLNPAVQGTAKMMSLAKENPARFAVASAAFVGLGMMVSMAGRMFSDDDDDGINKLDKVPAFKRATSMVLRADTPFAAIPIPYGWNAFFAAGTFAMDTAVGAQSLATTAKRIATATYEAFLPVGSSGFDSNKGAVVSAAKMVAPTTVLPIVEWMANENRYGGPIRKEGFPGQANPPDAYMAFRSANPIARGLAEGANNLTGGHRNKEGAVDFNPAIIDHAMNAYLPGVFNEIYKLAGSAVRLARGENLKEGAIPVVDRFSAPVREDSWNAAAYARVKELVDTKWREYEKAPSVGEMRATLAEYKGLGGAKAVVDSTSKAIRQLESRFTDIQLAADRGQISQERVVQIRNEYDEYKRKHYARAIKAAMQVGEGSNHPIRDALMGK